MIDNNSIELENHLDFFISENTQSSQIIGNIYRNKDDIIKDLQKLTLSTKVGKELEKELDYFIQKEKIILGNFNNFRGRLTYKKNNLFDCDIKLDINRTLPMLSAILVHELRHFQDFKNVFNIKNFNPISVFATEVNAFGDTYKFLKEINYLESKEYLGYPDVLKKLLKCSYSMSNKFSDSTYMSFLLRQMGYDRQEQEHIIYPKLQPKLNANIQNNSTKDVLYRILHKSKGDL